MPKSISLAALIALNSTFALSSEVLDRFIVEMHKSVGKESTNCFMTCNQVAAEAMANKAKLLASEQTYADASILRTLSSRDASWPEAELKAKLHLGQALARKTGIVHHVVPQSINSSNAFPSLKASLVAMHLPDLVEEEDHANVRLKPLRHCFLIARDESDATVCHSWEDVLSFECTKPMPLPLLETHLLDLHERVEAYLKDRNSDGYSSILRWFLGDKIAKATRVVLRKQEYTSLIESKAVKFFENRNDKVFLPAYFSFVAETDSQDELIRQLSLATFAGKGVFGITTFHAPHWQLISEVDL